ncbi:MAG: hypothetical protein WC586_12750 [Methanoregula sp.]
METDPFSMTHFPKKWHIIVGVIILVGIVGLFGMAIYWNHSVSNIYFIPAGTFSPMPQQSVIIPTSPSIEMNPTPTPCISDERWEYQVVQGKPFTYTGTVPDNSTQSVDVFSDTLMNPYPSVMKRPVDPYGKFSIYINGNETRQIWDDYISDTYGVGGDRSPYDHVCMRYSSGIECFNLLIVQDTNNLTAHTQKDWIRIDPIVDPVISEKDRDEYTGNFFINGTTNQPTGNQVHLVVTSLCFRPCPKMSFLNTIGCCGSNNYENVATIREGQCGINTWSVFVNTTPNRITISRLNGEYGDLNAFLVIATQMNRTKDDNRWDATQFVIRVR